MKKPRNEKRVVNLPKEDFDAIKEYCDANAFNLPKWIVKIVRKHIDKNVEKTIRSLDV